MEQMTFATAVKKYLTLPTEGAADIMRQVKSLTEKDREELTEHFRAVGVEIVKAAS